MAISGVSMTVTRTGHWAAYGVTYDDGFYADICTVTIDNTNDSAVIITSIKLPVGTGSGTVWGIKRVNGSKTWVKFTVTGAACKAKIINSSGTNLFSADVSTQVTVRSSGSSGSSGCFNNPSKGTIFTGSLTLNGNSSITLGVGINGGSGSTSGPILSCDNGFSDGDNNKEQISRNIDINGYIATCSISSCSISPTSVLAGATSTATCVTSPSDATKTYKWYNASGTHVHTGATRTPTGNGEYCMVTASKTGYQSSGAKKAGTITYYARVTNPAQNTLSITGSVADGRNTDRENYTFSWGSGTKGTNNNVDGYYLEVYRGSTKVKSETVTTTSKTYTASDLGISAGNSLYFKIKTKGKSYDADSWVTSNSINIMSSAVMHVNVSGSWKTGIVYVNKGTNNKPDWVEATEVKVKDGTQWKDSI